MTAIVGVQPSAQFGLGDYKDFVFDPYAFMMQAPIGADDGPGGVSDVSDMIAGMGHLMWFRSPGWSTVCAYRDCDRPCHWIPCRLDPNRRVDR